MILRFRESLERPGWYFGHRWMLCAHIWDKRCRDLFGAICDRTEPIRIRAIKSKLGELGLQYGDVYRNGALFSTLTIDAESYIRRICGTNNFYIQVTAVWRT